MFTHGSLAGDAVDPADEAGLRGTQVSAKPADAMTWSAGRSAPPATHADCTPPVAPPKSTTTDTPDEDEHAAAPAGADAPTSAAVVAVIAMMTATRRRTHPVGVSIGVTCCAARTS